MRSGMTLHGLFFKLEKKNHCWNWNYIWGIMIKNLKYNFYIRDIKMWSFNQQSILY